MDQASAILLATFVALFVSSIAGYGGSLILVPALGAILGPKEGIALAALLLAWNNVFKLLVYRRTVPLREGWPLIAVTFVGVTVGARILIAVPDQAVWGFIILVGLVSLAVELVGERWLPARRASSVPLMAVSAVLSGTSGSSGPLKGVSLRNMGWPRLEQVGLASGVSLVADAWKVELFAGAGLLPDMSVAVLVTALPMMPVAAFAGRWVNQRTSEEAFRWVFWGVVGAYTLRMVGVWW